MVKRELAISTGEIGSPTWSIDHVFLDQDGIPTLVEIKRKEDSRLGREVVGQMLDYAANCSAYWTLETLRTGFEATCREAGQSGDELLKRLLGDDADAPKFWQQVEDNLEAQRIRLVFVADVIPIELRRIVEFLNRQMNPVEVLAVELRQFVNNDLKTIVPTVYGHLSISRKRATAPRRWDEASLFDELARTVGEKEVLIARAIYAWMSKGGTRKLVFGTGKEYGSVYPVFKPDGISINPVYLSTDGSLWLQFASLDRKPVFGSVAARQALMQQFNAIKGVDLKEGDLTKYPRIPLRTIALDPEGETKALNALRWMEEQIGRA